MCYRNLTDGDEVWNINSWYKFDSEASAEAAVEDLEDDLRWQWGATNIDARVSGQFIKITADAEIPDS